MPRTPPPWECRCCEGRGHVGLIPQTNWFGRWLAGEVMWSWFWRLVRWACDNCDGTGKVEYERPAPPAPAKSNSGVLDGMAPMRLQLHGQEWDARFQSLDVRYDPDYCGLRTAEIRLTAYPIGGPLA